MASIVGIICLYQVIFSYDWQNIGQALLKANFFILFCSSVISIISYWFFRAVRWKILLSNEQLEISFSRIYLITAVSVGFSTITPFQSGEALKVEFLKRYGAGRFSGYGIFLLERLQDLLVVVGLGIFGVAVNFNLQLIQNYLYFFAAGLLLGILIITTAILWLPFSLLQPFREWFKEIRQSKYIFLPSLLLTFLSWMAVVSGWHFALKSVEVEIEFISSMTIVSLTTLVTIISFVPGAIGVSELTISGILIKLGTPEALAQTGAIAVRLYTLVILVLTLIHWLILSFMTKNKWLSMKRLPN